MPTQHQLLKSDISIPAWWASKAVDIDQELTQVRAGKVETISITAGERPVRAVFYGQSEPELRGTANFNAAVGAGRKTAYYDKAKRQHPVLFVLAGVHGHEVEGMMGALSLIKLMETGRDLQGNEQPELLEKLKRLRLIIIPLANPDGRERVPYDGWVGMPGAEMTKWGQGTKRNGESYGWRGSKGYHPMTGDVDILGGYFDDAGINMMHDNWADPMSETSRALLKLVAEEGPDCLLNLHTHSSPPCVLPSKFVPPDHAYRLHQFSEKYGARLDAKNLRHTPVNHLPGTFEEERTKLELPFNLQSMFYHVGADFGCSFESTHGTIVDAPDYGYPEILQIHHELFDLAAEEILEKR